MMRPSSMQTCADPHSRPPSRPPPSPSPGPPRRIRTDNAKFREKVIAIPGTADVLRLAGFTQAG